MLSNAHSQVRRPAPERTTSKLLEMMAKHITEHAPKGTDTEGWKY